MKTHLLSFVIIFLFNTALVRAVEIEIVTENLPPYSYEENGKITGYSTEIVRAVMKEAGLSYRINIYPWARAYTMASTNPDTLIYSIGRIPKRENLFRWIGTIAPRRVYFYKLKKRNDITITSLEDAKKYKVGSALKDVKYQYLLEQNFQDIDTVDYDERNIKKLLRGRFDIFPYNELTLAYNVKQMGLNLSDFEKVFLISDLSSDLYMAFSRGTSDGLVDRCRKALERIKKRRDP